jgi:ferredoxin--NADP+ reductase
MNDAGRPLRVAVVGSGPAGFYAAAALLTSEEPRAEVDLIERLPTPWGLVRLGVAPDHPNIKAVSRAFERIAARPGFRFLGNVEIGRDLTPKDLARFYDAVVYAFGSETDRRLGIPGEDLPGSWAATELVAWYNGHPDFQHVSFDLSGERAVVVGNGNVALDVARMLALTAEELAPTDTTDEAISAIVGAGIREIVVLGRRGPVQASFTTPELQEMGELAGADVVVDPAELGLDPASEAELAAGRELGRRNLDVLHELATRPPTGKPRRIVLRFRVSPVAILGEGRVEGVELVRNELVADERGRVHAVPTEERETLSCGVIFRSVGYRGVGLADVPFDEDSGTIPNEGGRVLGKGGEPVAGVYCAGWIKRGPTGVIGTNKKDATETVEHLLEDARNGRLSSAQEPAPAAILDLLAEREVEPVLYAGWEAIDALDLEGAADGGPPRVSCGSPVRGLRHERVAADASSRAAAHRRVSLLRRPAWARAAGGPRGRGGRVRALRISRMGGGRGARRGGTPTAARTSGRGAPLPPPRGVDGARR